MQNPKVSVIIPVYNGEKTLRQCLGSVLNQTYRDYEVIIVDNNSTDNTKSIIKELQTKSNKIKYVFEPKIGRGVARNTGIKNTREEIIAMVDSDCIVSNNWLEELIKPILYRNEIATMGAEDDLTKNYWTKNIQKASRRFIDKNLNGGYVSHIDTKNFAIKGRILRKSMFDPNLKALEEFDLYLRIKKDIKIKFLPLVVVGHHHSESLLKIIKLYFEKGYWVARIYKKHRKNKDFKNIPMFVSLSIKNFLKFPIWMAIQFATKPKESFFILISEISWRIGIIFNLLKFN